MAIWTPNILLSFRCEPLWPSCEKFEMNYIATIGLEVHVQLKTRSKMFCASRVEFGAEPNTHTCPVCLGLPGALPVMNQEALRMTVLTGLMLGCDIAPICKFDRKNYLDRKSTRLNS